MMLLRMAFAASRKLHTEVFNVGVVNWIAPPGVFKIERAAGYGAAGTPAKVQSAGGAIVDIYAMGGASGGASAGPLSWSTLTNLVNAARTNFNVGGAKVALHYNYTLFDDQSYTRTQTNAVSQTGVIANSVTATFSSGWGSGTFVVPSSGIFSAGIEFLYNEPATNGASTSAFDKAFPGGAGEGVSETVFENIPVVPGNSYQIIVRSGGKLTISYYK